MVDWLSPRKIETDETICKKKEEAIGGNTIGLVMGSNWQDMAVKRE